MIISETKKYFVFISYSSKDNEDDNKWAEWLLHELDYWHLPADYKGCKPVQDTLREVFRDRDSFSAGKEWDKQVEPKLKETQNLIVICSPNAAKSDAVNREIEIFINQGKEDFIFPFIIEGNSPDDCFPPALKHSKVGGDVNKDGGRDKAFIKVVAGMLGVNFDDLYNRYELEKAEQARLEIEKREKLQIAQSRFVAEKAMKLIDEGDSYLARRLLLKVLPTEDNHNIPVTHEAEIALRNACRYNTAVLVWHTHKVLLPSLFEYAICSPDGKYIVSAAYNHAINIWETKSGRLVREISDMVGECNGHTSAVKCVSFSSDGEYLASASADGTIKIWKFGTGELINNPLIGHNLTVNSVQFCHKNVGKIVSASSDKTIRIWDVINGEQIGKPMFGHTNPVTFASYSPDDKRILSVSSESIKVWNALNGEQIKTIPEQDASFAVFHPQGNGDIIVYASKGVIKSLNINTGKQVGQPLVGHSSRISFFSFNNDCTRIVSASGDTDERTIRIWDYGKGKEIGNPLVGHLGGVKSVVYSPDNKLLISASYDKTLRIWDAETDQIKEGTISGHQNHVFMVAFSPKGDRIVSASLDNTIRLWDSKTGQQLGKTMECPSGIKSANFSRDGNFIVSGLCDNCIKIWDSKSCEQDGLPLIGHTGSITSVAFSGDGKRIVSASLDKTIRIWDVPKRQQIGESLEVQAMYISSVCFSPDGEQILSASDGTLRLWNIKSKELIIQKLEGETLKSAVFSRDGKYVVTASNNVKIWSSLKLELICVVFEGVNIPIQYASFSPNGNYIIVAHNDKTIRVVDIKTRKEICRPLKHDWFVHYAEFSPDGKRIVSASDNKIKIWDYWSFAPLEKMVGETFDRFKNNPLTLEERRKYYFE